MILRLLLALSFAALASGFVAPDLGHPRPRSLASFGLNSLENQRRQPATSLRFGLNKDDGTPEEADLAQPCKKVEGAVKAALLAAALSLGTWTAPVAVPDAVAATDPGAIVGCLLSKCQVQFAKCISNPGCLANVICINSCNNKADETGCQIKCGDIFDNAVIGEFNKCAVSDMSCVPQKPDEGLYPEPTHEQMVPKFETKFFDGGLYITAGLNPLFDIFPCQVHFFTETSPGTFFGKLNWDIVEPDGELFTRDALQQFYQDPKEPAHLINHDNEYLHYKDDWYIIDYEYADNKDGIPPFAFVYYRGSNDAWDGYGGAVVYTQAAKLPTSLIPRLEAAAKKIGHSWDEFTVTDNTCKKPDEGEKIELRKRFLGDAVIQTEKQVQAQATRFRGNAVNSIKAQKLFFNNQGDEAQKAYEFLQDQVQEFEKRQ
jgi:violaxanthin de-epoxidase